MWLGVVTNSTRQEEHFTVIDVPGIFRKETEGKKLTATRCASRTDRVLTIHLQV